MNTTTRPTELPATPGSPSLGEALRLKVAQHAIKKREDAIKKMHAAMEEAADDGKLEVTINFVLSEADERKLWEQGILTSNTYEANKRVGTKLYWGGDLYEKNMEQMRKYYQKIDAKAKRAASKATAENPEQLSR
jgi:hypothetical protein